jgi:hypothetical protein
MKRVVTAWVTAVLAGCGTLASPGGGEADLPNNRTGPFRELTSAETGSQRCSAYDSAGSFDEPSAIRLPDGRVAVYGTRTRMGRRTIARTVLTGLATQTEEPADVLTATLPWQGMAVSSPEVTAVNGGYVMAYATGSGALGVARSTDGVTWQPLPSPALEMDAAMGEETALRAPTIVALANGGLVLAYASGSAIWLARTSAADGRFVRVDGDPSTPRRDPVLGATGRSSPLGDAGVGFESGAVDDPSLTVETTATGRTIWRMYYTARSVPQAMDGGVAPSVAVTLAASFDGLSFTRFGAPVVTSRTDPTLAAPSALAVDARRTLLFLSGRCDTAGRVRGVRAAIAPGAERLATGM